MRQIAAAILLCLSVAGCEQSTDTTSDANMDTHIAYARNSIAQSLRNRDIRAEIDGDVVKPGRGTPEIRITDLWFRDFQIPTETGQVHLAHIVIEFALNPERPESVITDCATGWAATEQEAIDQAVGAWVTITAPPIFSLLNSKAVMDAEWFPSGDQLGIQGWDVFSSPYGFRGDESEQQRLREYLDGKSLMRELTAEINAAATREHLNYVRIYRGFSGDNYHVECVVNGVRDDAASTKLEQMAWPQPEPHRVVSLGEFLILIKPLPTEH
jgi:hypothetical protein